jgi:hypothetical protein
LKPEVSYLALIRKKIVTHALDEAQGTEAAERLGAWRFRRASIPLIRNSWSYRHNMTAANADYMVLAEQLSAHFLTEREPGRGPAFRGPPKCSGSHSAVSPLAASPNSGWP